MQLLLLEYEWTPAVATLFRPVLLRAVAALVEAAVGGSHAGAAPQPSPEMAVALLTVLELAPHTEGWAAGWPGCM